jgi:hypothetical protein
MEPSVRDVPMLVDLFDDRLALGRQRGELDDLYTALRGRPAESRQLFDALVDRHNKEAATSRVIAGCCCCGVDLDDVDRSLATYDIEALEQQALEEAAGGDEDVSVANAIATYRTAVHEPEVGPQKHDKKSLSTALAARLYNRLTTPTAISPAEADYLYSALQHNECVAQDLFAIVAAGAQMAGLAGSDVGDASSQVVKAITELFQESGDGIGTTDSGGPCCCCCCCCCCCGGGC